MPLLNSRFSNFLLNFPKGWFYPEVIEMYDPFFRRTKSPYTNLVDFMNFTIQSVSWPAIAIETVTQDKKDAQITYKNGWDLTRQTEKNLTITFRTTEGFLNYFVMKSQLEMFFAKGKDAKNDVVLPDLNLLVLDHYGYLVLRQNMKGIVFMGLSELELSQSSNVPEYRTFTCDFKYSTLSFQQEFD